MALVSPQEIWESLTAQGWQEGWTDWISTWLLPLFLLFLCFLGKNDLLPVQEKHWEVLLPKKQLRPGEISLGRNLSGQEGAAGCGRTGTNTSLSHLFIYLWKNILLLVFPSHVREDILIHSMALFPCSWIKIRMKPPLWNTFSQEKSVWA